MGEDDQAYNSQLATFERLYSRIDRLLERLGRADSLVLKGEYSVYSDYWGYPQVKVTVHDLNLLQPSIVKSLQEVLVDFPGWEIIVAVAVREHYSDWPDIWLIIRGNEIVDRLQPQYFPEEFQGIKYEGSRPGTDRDFEKS